MKLRVKDQFSSNFEKKLSAVRPQAAHALALQVAEDTDPFVPAGSGDFASQTQVVDNKIFYPGPRAKFLYNGKVMVDADSGKGPMRIGGKNGAEVIRFRRGARLKAVDTPLKFKKGLHPLAQDHWFEASKAKNLDNWLRSAGKAVEIVLK